MILCDQYNEVDQNNELRFDDFIRSIIVVLFVQFVFVLLFKMVGLDKNFILAIIITVDAAIALNIGDRVCMEVVCYLYVICVGMLFWCNKIIYVFMIYVFCKFSKKIMESIKITFYWLTTLEIDLLLCLVAMVLNLHYYLV